MTPVSEVLVRSSFFSTFLDCHRTSTGQVGEEQLIPPRHSLPHTYEVNEETLLMMNKVPVMTQVMREVTLQQV